MRKYAREVAFSKIYEFLLNPAHSSESDFTQFDVKMLEEDDRFFVKELFAGVKAHFEEYSSLIAELSAHFKLERLFKVDLAILSLAMYEISKTETPDTVCINEAVELAKKFSSEKSAGFVNGVLAEFLKRTKAN